MKVKAILKFSIYIISIILLLPDATQAMDSWIQRSNFLGMSRNSCVSFNVHDRGYVGTGQDSLGNLLNDFWEYDPVTDTWSQKADFAGSARTGAIAFGIDPFGYIGLGSDINGFQKDLWRFDPGTNSWNQEQELGLYRTNSSNGRKDAAVTVTDGKAYVICGYDGTTTYVKQCWQFDPVADTSWTFRRNFANAPDFSSIGRRWPVAFGISPHIYFGTGYDYTNNYKKDFWRYNNSTDSWTQLADFPGLSRANASGFSLNGDGYLICGINLRQQFDMWRYLVVLNSWNKMADYPGNASANNTCFVLNNRVFIGLGNDSLNIYQNDLWEYVPDSTTEINELYFQTTVKIYPNPILSSFTLKISGRNSGSVHELIIYDAKGKKCINKQIKDEETFIERGKLVSGIYYFALKNGNEIIKTGKLLFD